MSQQANPGPGSVPQPEVRIDALILHAREPARTVAFYRALGLALEEEHHGDGPVHWACDQGGAHIAVFPADVSGLSAADLSAPGLKFGLRVRSVDEAMAAGVAAGGTIARPADTAPWGRSGVLRDPDGRLVELNQDPS